MKVSRSDEIIGRSVYDFIHPDWYDRVRSRVEKLYKEKKVLPRSELQYITADMETIHVEATGAYINYLGKPGILSVISDITDRKKAEESLQQSEKRFKGFFENSGAYCYMVSPEGTIIEVNASALQTLGYSKKELIGRPVSTIYSEESLAKSKGLFKEWKRKGKTENAELTISCKNGEKRTVLLNTDSIRDEEGKLLHSTSMQFDITEWRKMEERFRMMYEKSPIGVAIVDTANQGILQVNIRFCEILGYSEDELKGLTIPDITHPEDWERELHQIRSFTEKQSAEYIVEKRYIRKDGSLCWVKSRRRHVGVLGPEQAGCHRLRGGHHGVEKGFGCT